MGSNFLLALLCALLAGSPYISRIEAVNSYFDLRTVGNIHGLFEIFVIAIGTVGFLFACFNMFLRRKNGSPYLAVGALVVVLAFFYNEEKIPLPVHNALFGGELFFVFTLSFVLAVTGLVIEWLIPQPH